MPPDQPSASPAPATRPAVSAPLLGPDEKPPVSIFNPAGRAPVLLVCDHAARAVPACLGDLGVPAREMDRHIAYDIGAAGVTRALALALDAQAVLSGYSRLVRDLNRRPGDPAGLPRVSDGTIVPANQGLTAAEIERRETALFRPYHDAIAGRLDALSVGGVAPALVSIHSCTPSMNGFDRPWHIGVLWNEDPRIPVPLMAKLAAVPGVVVGDNQPYSGRDRHGWTVERHAETRGLANVLIEVRQDLIGDEAGIARWAEVLAGPFAEILADPDLYRPFRP